MTKYSLLLLLVIVMVVAGLFGGHFGYEVDGVPQGGGEYAELDLGWWSWAEGIIGVVMWVWDAVVFLFNMATFQIDGMPVFISAIFVVMSIMTMMLIVSLIRGTS